MSKQSIPIPLSSNKAQHWKYIDKSAKSYDYIKTYYTEYDTISANLPSRVFKASFEVGNLKAGFENTGQ